MKTAGALLLLIVLAATVLPPSLAQHRRILQNDLVVFSADGSTEYALTDNTLHEGRASWSPDGTRVVFSALVGGLDDLFVVDVDGKGLTNLTNSPKIGERTPSWSPDGRRIIYSAGSYTTRRREGSPIITRSVETSNIFVMNADGTNVKQITHGSDRNFHPVYSRDGSRIAFVSTRPPGWSEIFVMNFNGSNQQPVTKSPVGAYCDDPSWSPSGLQIAYTRYEAGSSNIYVSNVDSSRAFRITDSPVLEESPAWSPSGAWIAYSAQFDSIQQIYCVQPNGANNIRITTDGTTRYFNPNWSPDERFLVAQMKHESEKVGHDTTFILWDSGGISIDRRDSTRSRFVAATRERDHSVSTRDMTVSEARAWFARHRIPFPEKPEETGQGAE